MKTINIYRQPIDINKVSSIQGGSIAHVGDLIHSIDYDAPIGTPVYAALDGIVVAVKDDSNIGGLDQEFEMDGNFIEIIHANDEISEYEHINYKSAKVKIGDHVLVGEQIAEVGNTGWSECPHLHFMVFPKGQEYKTREIIFKK